MRTEDRPKSWDQRRHPRRRVLRGVLFGTVGLGLAGCTSTTEPPAATTAATAAPTRAAGAAPAPTPVAAQPKRGGIIKTMTTGVERSLEPQVTGAIPGTASFGPQICYSTLLVYKRGPDVKAPSYIP